MKDSYNLIDFIKMYYLDSNIQMYLLYAGADESHISPGEIYRGTSGSGKKNFILHHEIWHFFLFIKDRSSEKRSPYYRTGN